MIRWIIICTLILFIITLAAGQNRAGKDRALLFAVNDYESMTDLKNPVQNARDIAEELEKRYGFTAEVVVNPIFATMENKIQEYQRAYNSGRYDADGQLFIFFSGHGVMRGKNGYFMPADGDPERPYATGIEYDYWRSEIDDINCRHILAIVDACHSITFDPNWENKTDRRFTRPGERLADQTLLNHQQYRARLFFTSDATGNQTPDRSTFARQLLEGLRTHPASGGYLTSSELFASYLLKASPTPGGGDFGSDEPGSCFLFFPQDRGVDPEEERLWQIALEMKTREALGFYLQRYPDGHYREEAEKALQGLPQSWVTPEGEEWVMEKDKPGNMLNNMVLIEGGSFEMGDVFGEGEDNEKPAHTVTVSDFYLGRHEVTFEEYDAYCAATGRDKPEDQGWGRGRRPVINVSWLDAVAYCNWRSRQEGLREVYTISGSNVAADWAADGYRLPTEAEWEYAARSRGKKNGSTPHANIADESAKKQNPGWTIWEGYDDGYVYTATVGSFEQGDLGLSDMTGNVWEWCWDWYGSGYYEQSKHSRDPRGPDSGSSRVVRGGSWTFLPAYVRVADRRDVTPGSSYSYIGFRLARAVR